MLVLRRTWRRNNIRTTSTRVATSSVLARCCTRCSPVNAVRRQSPYEIISALLTRDPCIRGGSTRMRRSPSPARNVLLRKDRRQRPQTAEEVLTFLDGIEMETLDRPRSTGVDLELSPPPSETDDHGAAAADLGQRKRLTSPVSSPGPPRTWNPSARRRFSHVAEGTRPRRGFRIGSSLCSRTGRFAPVAEHALGDSAGCCYAVDPENCSRRRSCATTSIRLASPTSGRPLHPAIWLDACDRGVNWQRRFPRWSTPWLQTDDDLPKLLQRGFVSYLVEYYPAPKGRLVDIAKRWIDHLDEDHGENHRFENRS